ncbi:MAG: glycosyl hydrolase 53 family protein, partial [Eubacterium sp.]|nr:glycosyl hydrolase 53 family protein [Eubacterium sp.]
MEKKLSIGKRMLVFVLTFAMVFTAISWGELGGVKVLAEETNLLPSGCCDGDALWSDWQISYDEGQNYDTVIGKNIGWSNIETNWKDAIKSGTGSWSIGVTTGANLYIGTKNDLTSKMETGKKYIFSGYIFLNKDPGNGTKVNDNQVTETGKWTQFSVEYTAQESNNYPFVKIYAPSGTGFYLDELSIVSADTQEPEGNVTVEEIPCYQYDFSDDGDEFYHGSWNVSWAGDASWGTTGYYDNIEGGKKNYWIDERLEAGTDPVGIMTRTVSNLPAGEYKLYFDVAGKNVYAEISLTENGNSTNTKKTEQQIWDWASMSANSIGTVTIEEGGSLDITVKATLSNQWATGIKFGNINLVQIKETSESDKEEKKNELQTLYDANKDIVYKNKGYTSASIRAFESAIAAAKNTLENNDATLLELTTAYKTLNAVVTAGFQTYDEIIINKVENYDTSSIRGADVSTYLALMDAFDELNKNIALDSDKYGFRDWDGNLLDKQGFFDFIAGEGVNYIRTRVWNDPYNDAQKTQGYGGGNNDLEKAIEIGKLATDAGMSNLIDFHLSDFWADPERQRAPKTWANYSADQKAQAAKEYILDALNQLKNAGVDVGMVQIGNETNPGIAGESWGGAAEKIISAGCQAVDEFNTANGTSIKKVVHFTAPNSSEDMYQFAENLKDVQYDIFATSYYPDIHGGIDNLKTVLTTIASTYNKYVMVAETSWGSSTIDADGVGNKETKNDELGYGMSPQWQAHEIRDIINAVNSIDVTIEGKKAGLGMFYWELAWLPVMEGSEKNQQLWHDFGVGWASSNAKDYDIGKVTEDGGNPNDNQILFDPNGNPLLSLKVFGNVQNGIVASNRVFSKVEVDPVTIHVTDQFGTGMLPSEAIATYNDRSTKKTKVTYNTADVQALQKIIHSNESIGQHIIHGETVVDGTKYNVSCMVTVDPVNILQQGSFEKATSEWQFSDTEIIKRKSGDNPKTGNWAANYFSKSNSFSFEISQSIMISKTGTYSTYAYTQGEENSKGIKIVVSASSGEKYESEIVNTTGWNQWKKIEISNMEFNAGDTVTYRIVSEEMDGSQKENGLWGSVDDIYLYLDPTGAEPMVIPPVTSGNSSSGTSSSVTDSTQNKDNTTITKNEDGTTTETKTETTTNESGKEVETTVTTQKDADGKVTGSTEVSTIANVAKNTEVTVTVEKDAAGKVAEAAAEVTKKGATTKDGTKGTIAGVVVDQIKEAAGTADIAITTSVTDAKGKEKYSVTVNASDLVAGEKLTVVVKDEKTGKTVLVDAKQVKVTVNGGVNVVLPEGKDYTLIDTKEAEKVTKEILKTVAPVKTSATLKEGKKATAKLSKKLDMDNVKKITYVSSKKSVATVDQNGKV